MREKVRSFFKYSITIIIIVITLLVLMFLTLITIPREKIENNISKSEEQLELKQEIKILKEGKDYSFLHIYADGILLNIIYCMDETAPLKSIIEAKYYKGEHHQELDTAIELQSNGNTEYLRYWHGGMTIIRPLLVFFDIQHIYYIFAGIMLILLITLFTILIKKKNYILIFAMIIGLILTASIYVPFCLEYIWTYLLMLVSTIIAVKLENKEKGNIYINMLMFVTGILTCFLDFLSTEIITFLIPILFIITIRYKEKRIKDIKQLIKQLILWIALWGTGYILMWLFKWLIAAVFLNINSLEYVKEKAMIRITGDLNRNSLIDNIFEALKNNFNELYIIYMIKDKIIASSVVIALIVAITLLRKKDKKDLLIALVVICIGILPYLRFIILANHAATHYFFTFRAQIVTIIALIIAIYIIVDKNKFLQKVEITKKEKKK